MNFARCEAIARAVLYEGYNLYPYRPSALKNRRRWTFGSVFPRDWAALVPDDRGLLQTQCLLRGGAASRLEIRLHFLHIVAREIGALPEPIFALPGDGEPNFHNVPMIEIDGALLFEWEEAREREIVAGRFALDRLIAAPARIPFAFAAEREMEPVRAADGRIAALIIRSALALQGEIAVAAERAAGDACRITVQIANTTPLAAPEALGREIAQRAAFASTHLLLGVERGGFVSLLDPPPELAAAAAQCDNRGTWPVLVGEDGATDLVLSAPIILYDYPRVAPESPGDLFDGTEIDEILTLRILTLTEAEKREIAAADPRSRAMLERTEALTAEELARLHGAFRNSSSRHPPSVPSPARRGEPAWGPVKIGDRVRLKPKPGGDVMDVVLKDQIGVVEAVEYDFEDRVHVAVTILDDPGRDLGIDRMPGHRFFFAQDEIEPLAGGETA